MSSEKQQRKDKGNKPAAKRSREGSSKTDDEYDRDESAIMERLDKIEEKLITLLAIVPEYKLRISKLEEEKMNLQTSLENAQGEIDDMKVQISKLTSEQQASNTNQKRFESELDELRRRHIKLECHSRRSNIKFFGIEESGHETNEDTEEVLRKFLRNTLKVPSNDEPDIAFDRVHRIASRTSSQNNKKPRPIIAKLTHYHDKDFIKSFIRNLPKGSKFGISDDFPKEIDEIRRKLYPVLKTAKKEKKNAFFNVDKLIIEGSVYRGSETSNLSLYGRIMDS